MRLLLPDHLNVHRHLATEAICLQEAEEPILMLWFSSESIVCGKHQNLAAEVDYAFCRTKGIALARRISGGGTVYHDPGNLNFSFIQPLPEGLEKAIDYKRYLEPMRAALRALGIETTYSYKDDLLLNGLKISGNAQHIDQRRKWALHHGTLLYNADLGHLSAALKTKGQYQGKAIASRPSPVVNIQEALQTPWTAEEFRDQLAAEFQQQFSYRISTLSAEEEEKIEALQREKIGSEAWILGYSPSYTHQRTLHINEQSIELLLNVERGFISDFRLTAGDREPWKAQTQLCLGKALSEALFCEQFAFTDWNKHQAYLQFI
ncbi:MAG: lipoyl protein ligase domain-containing protein [Bacteroidia bacterium]